MQQVILVFFSSSSAGRSGVSLRFRTVNPAGKNSRPDSPRRLHEGGYLHIFCASVPWNVSGDFSSQTKKCMQMKMWHKQALEDEHYSSKKATPHPTPFSFITNRKSKLHALAVKTNPACLALVHSKAPNWNFLLIWFENLRWKNPLWSLATADVGLQWWESFRTVKLHRGFNAIFVEET